MSDNLREVASAVEAVANASLLRPNAKLDHAVENSAKHGLPRINISPLQGQFLAIQCQLIGAKTVLEIGTLGGYSTIWFAQAGAKVTSIEINPKHRAVALENLEGLDAEIILGPALEVMPRLAAEGRQFDMVFVDADWGEQWEYFDWAVKLTRPKGCVYVDNVVREMLESGTAELGKESLVTKVGKDERVTATLVPILSSLKRRVDESFDAFILAIVN